MGEFVALIAFLGPSAHHYWAYKRAIFNLSLSLIHPVFVFFFLDL